MTSQPSTAHTLEYWLSDPELLRAPLVAIPHLALEGRVTLLSGREKVGKSTLVAGAVARASRGEPVLGVDVPNPVRTIWYALDEPLADAVRRFDALGADPEGVIINSAPRTVTELLSAIESDLRAFDGVDVITVDTLSRILAASRIDANDARQVEPVIAEIVDLCHGENLSAILKYHTGKAGREYRGSTSIGATVDEILTLRRRGQSEHDDFDDDGADDGRRLLVQDGRNLRGRIHLACVNGVYSPYDDAHPPRERILALLSEGTPIKSRSECAKLAHVQKAKGLAILSELIAEGVVVESAGVLRLADRFPPRAAATALEPLPNASRFRGSERFSERGTTPEPTSGTGSSPTDPTGSRSGTPPSPETGTARARPRRTIERDGREVQQELRPTAHGDVWLDADAAA